MEHRQIIDWAIEATQELLQKQGNNIKKLQEKLTKILAFLE